MASKITRLAATEVANACALPKERVKGYLERLQTPKVFWSYEPVRKSLPGILLVKPSLDFELCDGDDSSLIKRISRICTGEDQRAANVAVAEALIGWRKASSAKGVLASPGSFRMSTGEIKFCSNYAVILNSEVHLVHFDFRSQMKLTRHAKEFMKSAIHHTAREGDLRDAQVSILSTPSIKDKRSATFETLSGQPEISFAEIRDRVLHTYSIWELILMQRRSEASKKGNEGGSLL